MYMSDDDDLFDIDDIEDDDDDLLFDDDDLDDEGLLLPGNTVWGLAWIVVSAVVDLADTQYNFWHNVRTDLAWRHNKTVDDTTFVGSVEAGIEQL